MRCQQLSVVHYKIRRLHRFIRSTLPSFWTSRIQIRVCIIDVVKLAIQFEFVDKTSCSIKQHINIIKCSLSLKCVKGTKNEIPKFLTKTRSLCKRRLRTARQSPKNVINRTPIKIIGHKKRLARRHLLFWLLMLLLYGQFTTKQVKYIIETWQFQLYGKEVIRSFC